MIINHNMSAINANRQMATNQANTAKSTEKLSSGLRINRAGDDAAGLAISEKMRAQISGLNQASSNAQDGISMIQTAEGALNETHSILQRMRELSVQSSNDTNTADDRNEIQKEVNQLTSEINRIGNTTEYNTQKVLKGGPEATGKITVETTTAGVAPAPVSGQATGATSANLTANVGGLTGATATFTVGTNSFTLSNDDIIALKGKSQEQAAKYIAENAKDSKGVALGSAASVSFTKDGNLSVTANKGATGIDVDIQVAAGTASTNTAENLLGIGTATTIAGSASTAGQATAQNAIQLDTEIGNLTNAKVEFTVGSATFTLANDDIIALKGKTETDAAAYIAEHALDADKNKLGSSATVSFTSNKLTVTATTAALGTDVAISVTSGTASTDTAETLLGIGTASKVSGANIDSGTKGQSTITIDTNFAAGDQVEINGKVYTAIEQGNTAKAGEFVVGADTDATATDLLRAIKEGSDGAIDTLSTVSGSTITLIQGTPSTSEDPFVIDTKTESGFNVTLQIGANNGQNLNIEIGDMRASALGISGTLGQKAETEGASFVAIAKDNDLTDKSGSHAEYALDISTSEKATSAIEVIDKAITKVSSERSKIGAYQNRLEHTINNLGTSSENLTSAESRIRDVDMAEEMMEFTKNNVLSQASQAMLAQAKALPNQVLSLLQ